MMYHIPEQFVKADKLLELDVCVIQNYWNRFNGHPILKLESGGFTLEIHDVDSIRRLKELCEFALVEVGIENDNSSK